MKNIMKLAHTMIRVKSIDESLDFYCNFLGLREVRRHEINNEATLIFLSDEKVEYFLELTFNHDDREYQLGDQFGHIALVTKDFEAIVNQIKESGRWYRESNVKSSSKYVFVKDPNGYDIEILQEKPKQR